MGQVSCVVKISLMLFLLLCTSQLFAMEQPNRNIPMENDADGATTLVVTSEPRAGQTSALKEYVQNVMPLLLSLGGKVVKRNMISDTINGNKSFTFLLVMDFPSKTALKNMFESAEYKKLVPIRDKGFEVMNIHFADTMK